MLATHRIYLASSSPRRRELLGQIHVDFEVLAFRGAPRLDPDVSEAVLPGEAALAYAQRVARAKADAGLKRLEWRQLPSRPVLAADTTVVINGEILGKPDSAEHAVVMLRALSGTVHQVITAVAIALPDAILEATSVSDVRFRDLDEAEIRRYVATREPLDKAGAYGIQGRAAAFVEEIRGSYSGIVGLPLFETACLLRQAGYPI